jgi:cytochrome P450
VFDPLDPEHRPDPHPLYHRMRSEAPVHRGTEPSTGRGIWFLTRYAHVQRALHHPALRREFDRLPAALAAPHRAARDRTREGMGLGRHVLNLDPPDHTRLRRLITPAFGARTSAALAPRIRRVTADLLDPVDGEVDLVEALAMPLPVIVIAELLGIPGDDRTRFRRWVDGIFRSADEPTRHRSATELVSYLEGWIARRRHRPADDLLSRLASAEQQGDRLSHTELLSTVFLLLVAGHETTVNLIGNGVLELLRHPGELARLRRRPGLVASAVEEILRFNGPVKASTLRFAFDDVDFDGVMVPRGEAVMPLLLAANRDPAVFPEPDRFDITRDPNRHLGFGHGIHFCLGAQLARLEGRIAIDALVRRFPTLALATDPGQLDWLPGHPLHGVRRLPVLARR